MTMSDAKVSSRPHRKPWRVRLIEWVKTGVLAGYRGRGVSVAMKLLTIEFARQRGVHWLRAFHHPGNTRAIAMNRRLGFADEDPHLWTA
jgi:RimJ/RimL family protein N-acetyltransferase